MFLVRAIARKTAGAMRTKNECRTEPSRLLLGRFDDGLLSLGAMPAISYLRLHYICLLAYPELLSVTCC